MVDKRSVLCEFGWNTFWNLLVTELWEFSSDVSFYEKLCRHNYVINLQKTDFDVLDPAVSLNRNFRHEASTTRPPYGYEITGNLRQQKTQPLCFNHMVI